MAGLSTDNRRGRKRRSGLAGMVTDFIEKRYKTDVKDEKVSSDVSDALRKKLFQNGDKPTTGSDDDSKVSCRLL